MQSYPFWGWWFFSLFFPPLYFFFLNSHASIWFENEATFPSPATHLLEPLCKGYKLFHLKKRRGEKKEKEKRERKRKKKKRSKTHAVQSGRELQQVGPPLFSEGECKQILPETASLSSFQLVLIGLA